MNRVPEVEITRSLADPAKSITAFLDFAEMMEWEHWVHAGRFASVSQAELVFAEVSNDEKSVTWKFKFQHTDAAKAFNEAFDQ